MKVGILAGGYGTRLGEETEIRLRIDRMATLGFFHPVAQRLRRDSEAECAILMYHSISEAPEHGVHPYFQLNTSPRQFALHMDILASSDWEVVPLTGVLAPDTLWTTDRKRGAITFDDGFEDFLTHAFPVPEHMVHRKKKGFDNPIDKWLRNRMKSFAAECLLSEGSSVKRYFDSAYIRSLLDEHECGRQNYLRHIYLLISFELWHQKFIAT